MLIFSHDPIIQTHQGLLNMLQSVFLNGKAVSDIMKDRNLKKPGLKGM